VRIAIRLVGDDHDGNSGRVQVLEDRHDLNARAAVERAGGFVRKNEDRIVDQRACNRHALLLPAR